MVLTSISLSASQKGRDPPVMIAFTCVQGPQHRILRIPDGAALRHSCGGLTAKASRMPATLLMMTFQQIRALRQKVI
jgi:hypothetical protein